MIHNVFDIEINSPIEEVYKVAETYPMFVRAYDTKQILKNTSEENIVRIGYKYFGVSIAWEGIGQKKKNQYINYTQDKGPLKGMCANWIFQSVQDRKTKVSISVEFAPPFLLKKFFSKKTAKIIRNILVDLKYQIEANT